MAGGTMDPMIGLKRGTVRLLPHQEKWSREAEQTIRDLKKILGNTAVDIQHIGSTAVPLIYAKPVIDIAVGLYDVQDILPYEEELRKYGFVFRGEDVPGQALFVKGDFEKDFRTHHIHAVKWKGREWERYLDFRDYLNAFPEKAMEYDQLKRKLALQFSEDRRSYTEGGKQQFIEAMLGEARLWRLKQ